jgi:TolB protein
VKVSFRLMDVAQKKQLTSGEFTVTPDRSREVAHTIADMIYQAITGQKGIFNTRVVYVLKSGRNYMLQVGLISDVDSNRAQTILRSKEPIISPSWSPDGRYLAYVSFESKKPVVWVQDLATGQRRAVANFKGSNSAPAWSPDGSKLAVVLTTTGNSQIYLVNTLGGRRAVSVIAMASIPNRPSPRMAARSTLCPTAPAGHKFIAWLSAEEPPSALLGKVATMFHRAYRRMVAP